MILLQAMIGLAIVLLIFAGGSLLIGIPLITYLLNQKSRRKMEIFYPDRLPEGVMLLNFLAAAALTVLFVFIVCFVLGSMIDGRFT